MNEPTYSAKLKRVAEEIKTILRTNDVAGMIALHTPEIMEGVVGSHGASEYLLEITPSYSAIEWTPARDGVTIRGHRKHYDGDTAKRDKALRDTINMLRMLSDSVGPMVLHLMELAKKAETTWDAEHTPGTNTSHQAPLN